MKISIIALAAILTLSATAALAGTLPTVTANVPIPNHQLQPQTAPVKLETLHTGDYSMALTPDPAEAPYVSQGCTFVATTVTLHITRNGDDLTFDSPEGHMVGKLHANGQIIVGPPPHATNMSYGFDGTVTSPGVIEGHGRTRCMSDPAGGPSPFLATITGSVALP